MNDNPYAPPTAVVAEIGSVTEESAFFPASVTKLIVMSLCTFCLYEIFWFYQNWKRIKEHDGENISPPLRAIFALFFCYQLFSRIREFANRHGLHVSLAAGPLAAGWIVATLLWRLPDPYWMVSLLAFVFVVPVQVAVNRINAAVAPSHAPNAKFSALNWVGVAVGIVWWILVLVGLFFTEG